MKTFSAFLLLSLLWLTGCGRRQYAAYDLSSPTPVADQAYSPTQPNGARPEGKARKIISSAYLELVVDDPDSTVARVVALANAYGGFMTETSSTGATIRVPAERLAPALDEIATYGKVTSRRTEGEDVTDQYFDLGVRLENAERARQRYLELLARAESVKETLLVERELERLNETIDLLKGQRSRMNQLETFATLRVRVERKVKLGPLGYVVKGMYGAVKWLFVRK